MFRREIKKQFNENKYNLLTRKGATQITHQQKRPFMKQVSGTIALTVLGFNVTKRYCTFPHYHKDHSHEMTLANGELHPFEHQHVVSFYLSFEANCLNIHRILERSKFTTSTKHLCEYEYLRRGSHQKNVCTILYGPTKGIKHSHFLVFKYITITIIYCTQ